MVDKGKNTPWTAVHMEDHWEVWDCDGRTKAVTAYESDAQKLAAAPEMLAALEALDIYFGTMDMADWPGCIQLMFDAMDKARGEGSD